MTEGDAGRVAESEPPLSDPSLPPPSSSSAQAASHSNGEPNILTAITQRENWFLKVLQGAIFVDTAGISMVAPFFPAFSRRFGFHQETIALLLGVRSFTAIVAAIPIGILLRFLGHRRVLMFSFTLAIAACLLLAFPRGWETIAIALCLQGFCTQAIRTGSVSFATSLFSRSRRSLEEKTQAEKEASDVKTSEEEKKHAKVGKEGGTEEGEIAVKIFQKSTALVAMMGVIYCWTSLGGVLGPVVGSYLFQFTSPWIPFVAIGGLCLILALTFSFFRLTRGGGYELAQKKEGERPDFDVVESSGCMGYVSNGQQQQKKGFRKLTSVPSMPSIPENQDVGDVELGTVKGGVKDGQKNATLWTLFLAAFDDRVGRGILYFGCMQSMAWGVYEVVLPYFLTKNCGYNTAEIGVAFGINNFVYSVLAFYAGPLVSMMGPNFSVFFGCLLLATTLPLMCIRGFSCSMGVQYALNGLNGVSFALIETPLLAMLVDVVAHAGIHDDGLLVSIYQLFYTVGYAVAPFFAALLFLCSMSVGVMGATSLVLIAGFPVWFLGRRSVQY